MNRRTWTVQCEGIKWLMEQEVATTASRNMSPHQAFNLTFAWFDLFYSEKKANHVEMSFYRECI